MVCGCFPGCCLSKQGADSSAISAPTRTQIDMSALASSSSPVKNENPMFQSVTAVDETTKYANIPDNQLDDFQRLQKYCPDATKEECTRFLEAKHLNYDLALEQLTSYLKWRKELSLDEESISTISPTKSDEFDFESCATSEQTVDELDWHHATDKAIQYLKSVGKDTTRNGEPLELPQLARIVTCPGSDEHLKCSNNDRILHLLMAQMDPHIASDMTFALTIAFYLDRKLSRNSMEKMTIVLDVRAGHGWANPRPNQLIPFIRHINHIMERNFPERLSKLILFPMPSIATAIWKIIRAFLDPNTARKIAVISGSSSEKALPPYKVLEKHLDRKAIDRMEELRLNSFIYNST